MYKNLSFTSFVLTCALVGLFGAASDTSAAVYKTVGADGKIIYTDQPPADVSSNTTVGTLKTTTLNIAVQPSSPLPASVLKYQQELAAVAARRVRDNALTATSNKSSSATPTLFSAAWCGYCRRAKSYLSKNKISFQEIDIDTESGARAFFDAGGGSGVPMLIVDGKVLRGFTESAYNQVFTTSSTISK